MTDDLLCNYTVWECVSAVGCAGRPGAGRAWRCPASTSTRASARTGACAASTTTTAAGRCSPSRTCSGTTRCAPTPTIHTRTCCQRCPGTNRSNLPELTDYISLLLQKLFRWRTFGVNNNSHYLKSNVLSQHICQLEKLTFATVLLFMTYLAKNIIFSKSQKIPMHHTKQRGALNVAEESVLHQQAACRDVFVKCQGAIRSRCQSGAGACRREQQHRLIDRRITFWKFWTFLSTLLCENVFICQGVNMSVSVNFVYRVSDWN